MALLAVVAWPLASALFLALVFAGALWPLQERLATALRGRRSLAAGLLVVGLLLVVIGPLAWLATVLIAEALEAIRYIVDIVRSEGTAGLIERLPAPLDRFGASALERAGAVTAVLEKQLSGQGARAASALVAALLAAGTLLFQLAMMLIALFFLLIQGRSLLAWVDATSPLRAGQTQELVREVGNVSHAVIISSLVTAAVQAATALVGYLIAGVPHPLFFTFVTFLVAIVPAIGAGLVVLFAALLLLLAGHPYMSAFLAAWGVVVVSLIDNVVRPYLIKDEVEMGGAVVFFALVGGLLAFGAIGLLLGPLAVALFLALVRMYQRDYRPAR